jgi:TM2 domain-containing membrane protein YozV
MQQRQFYRRDPAFGSRSVWGGYKKVLRVNVRNKDFDAKDKEKTMADVQQKAADEAFCPSCGAVIKKDAEICPKCGVRQLASPQAGTQAKYPPGYQPKSNLTALLLCFFLGALGVHRFYVGKTGTGILMILTLGGLGIWALVDFIMICCNKFTDKQGYLLQK